jgi:hypothetical protein
VKEVVTATNITLNDLTLNGSVYGAHTKWYPDLDWRGYVGKCMDGTTLLPSFREIARTPTVVDWMKEEKEPVRGLFRVYIVDPKTDEVITCPSFVAKDANNAQIRAVQKAGDKLTRDIDEYVILVERIGDVPAKRAVQEVKMVEGN